MKHLIFASLFLAATTLSAQELQPSTRPNASQRDMQERGYGMFMHFGVNTFTDDEWSDGTTPASRYNPTHLDPDQWVRVARDAGFRYVLLITKHHDGFCLWDSKYTDYDVASSPVKTDVVRAISQACKKYGIKFAIYYSLWDRHEPSYRDKDFGKYIQYMENQLTELLTNYGPVCELWFDGGWDKQPDQWQLPRIYSLVKRLQPQCAMGVNQTITNQEGHRDFTIPETMTQDNRYYFYYFPSDFRLWDPKIVNTDDHKQFLHKGQSYYLPFEHTICLSKTWTWFQKSHPVPTRSLDELEELFYRCTSNGNALVINVPPASDGRIRENEANTIIALGQRLGIKAGKPLPKEGKNLSYHAQATATSVWQKNNANYGPQKALDGGLESRWAAETDTASLIVTLNPKEPFNKIVLFEYLQRIQQYTIDIQTGGEWRTIYVGEEPTGSCKVIRLPQPCYASQIRLHVTKASDAPSIYQFDVINQITK